MGDRLWLVCLILALAPLAQPLETSTRTLFIFRSAAATGGSAQEIPGGSLLTVRLIKSLDAKKDKSGDPVEAKVMADLELNDQVTIAKGSKIIGHLTDVQDKTNNEAQSKITMVFERAVLKGGTEVPLTATIQAIATPVDDRTADMTNIERGAGSLGITAT